MRIGDLVELARRHRAASGLSQRELARLSGVSERTIRDMEHGVTRPRRQSLRAVAGALGLTGADLVVFLAAGRTGGRAPASSPWASPAPPQDGQVGPGGLVDPGRLIDPDGLADPDRLADTDGQGGPVGLVGRRRELGVLTDLVLGGRRRLITVIGPGGVGKTHLVAALAAALRGRTDLEIRLVDLSAVTDPALVGELVAEAVTGTAHPAPRLSAVDRVAAELRGRRLLLVLDRLERLVSTAPGLATLVSRCPGLTVVVTSQRPLRVTGERLVHVDPLPVPEAVELFARRAREAASGFELGTGNAVAVAAVCERVGGLPLAVELAAARMRTLTPAELAARLDRQLPILTGGAVDQPARHQSLRATIESSLELLTAAGRSMFGWLGAFVAGGDLDDVEAVAGALGRDTGWTIAALTDLVDTGLVRASTGTGRSRYTMPDAMAELAEERLSDDPQGHLVRRAVARRFLLRLRQWCDEPTRAGELVDGRDADNLRSALAWTLRHRPAELTVGVVHALGRYYEVSGRYVEGESVLSQCGDAGQALGWVAAGRLALLRGDLAHGEHLGRRALADVEPSDQHATAAVQLLLGTAASERRDAVAARRHLRVALRAARRAGDDALTGRVFNNLGVLSATMADLRSAERQFSAALTAKRRSGAGDLDVGRTLNNLAELARHTGRMAAAAERGTEAARLLHAAGHHRAAAQAASSAALALLGCGRLGPAVEAIGDAVALLHDEGDDERTTTIVALRRSVVQHAAGQPAEASILLARTLPAALRADHRVREEVAFVLAGHAEVVAGRDPWVAAGLLGAAAALFERSHRPVPPAPADTMAGTLRTCRAALGAESCRAAYQRGATLETVVLAELAGQLGPRPR